jgi:hypothetical protein|tara:strand:+ start:284 stop:1105 length:822 start_codon:yes stop_codon:yes gene_type:complete
MKKALAQNPNLLRTLIGLSLTLIVLLSYAVYGATISPNYYIYETEATDNSFEDIELTKVFQNNETTWIGTVSPDGQNLTWINMTIDNLASGAIVKMTNEGKLYSHPFLGVPDAEVEVDGKTVDFRCSEHCTYTESIEVEADSSQVNIQSLTSTDPARRSNGTVYADSLSEAEELARKEINYSHEPSQIVIQIIEPGDKSVQPQVNIHTVNEEFANIAIFEIDAATEFLWALAAVVGCFSMVLIPSFTVYFAARAKERRNEEKLRIATEEHANE